MGYHANSPRKWPDGEMNLPKNTWCQVPDDCFEAPEAEPAKLSAKQKTEVLWMGLQSAVEAFIFHRWQDGKARSALVCEKRRPNSLSCGGFGKQDN
jgi:hypothetical protein